MSEPPVDEPGTVLDRLLYPTIAVITAANAIWLATAGEWWVALAAGIYALGAAFFLRERRFWLKIGYLRGRRSTRLSMAEAGRRGMGWPEWYTGELEKDAIDLGIKPDDKT